ncbi:hypothetical protein [Ralstonia sp. UBA689]|uniref:hypothetical protein n=1 Tax=Ralstonia sp. UBA689 TaxID=1947373 RepID=UPI0025DAD59A|nr:hypothetical protein [Ralstonia sp. UBA689]
MPSVTATRMMAEAQQAQLIEFVRIGLQWMAGQLSFDVVVQRFGQPKKYEQPNNIEYVFYLPDMSVEFQFDKLNLINGKPRLKGFKLEVDANVYTNIPYTTWDSLGMVRAEPEVFFDPTGRRDVSGWDPKNYAAFKYRLPMPPDSPFTVSARFSYLGEWVNEYGDATLNNFRNAINLRDLSIGRYYLTPDDLQKRQQAKRQKYGEMRLCTGMICPETAIWEGWTPGGLTDKSVVWAGQMFPRARTIPLHIQSWSPSVDALWMWHGPYSPDKPLG